MQHDTGSIYPDCPAVTRTVAVGGLSKAELLREFDKHAISMNAYAKRLFDDVPFTMSQSPQILETVELQVRHLGLPDGATSGDIYDKAAALGLTLCPIDLAPYLRLQYLEQPEGFWITIASPKPYDDPAAPNGFYLRRLADGLWLRGYWAAPEHLFGPEEHFVFYRQ